jgi:hypothetical protein
MSEPAIPQPAARPRLSANGSAPRTSSLAAPSAPVGQHSHARTGRAGGTGVITSMRRILISQLGRITRRAARRP